jgi:hypothetical protein
MIRSKKPWQKGHRVPRAEFVPKQVPPLPPPEWRKIILQIASPNDHTGDPGTVVEAEYARVPDEVWVDYNGKVYRASINPDDNLRAAAQRLLSAKWRGGQSPFNDPIPYDPQRWIV